MGKREELIENVARAMAEPYLGAVRHPAGVRYEPWKGLIPAATAALDAILAGLKDMDDGSIAYAEGYSDLVMPEGMINTDQARRDELKMAFNVLLSTLEETKP